MCFRKYLFSIVALLSVASIFAMKETTVEIITGPIKRLEEVDFGGGDKAFALRLCRPDVKTYEHGQYFKKIKIIDGIVVFKPVRETIMQLPEKLMSQVKLYKDPEMAQNFYMFIIKNMQELSTHVKNYPDKIELAGYCFFCVAAFEGAKLRQVPYIPLLHKIITEAGKDESEKLIKVLIPGSYPGDRHTDHTEILTPFTTTLKGLGFRVKEKEVVDGNLIEKPGQEKNQLTTLAKLNTGK